MLQRFNFALFSKGPPVTNHESPRRAEGRGARRFSPRALPFPSWGRLSENIPLEPPRKRKGEVFTLEAPLLLQSAAKEERAAPRRHSASATSTASCSRPLEPDTCIFPGEPISRIHASPPKRVAGRHLRRTQGL